MHNLNPQNYLSEAKKYGLQKLISSAAEKAVEGNVKVLEIQGENAKRMNIGDFLRGNNIEVGNKFEK